MHIINKNKMDNYNVMSLYMKIKEFKEYKNLKSNLKNFKKSKKKL